MKATAIAPGKIIVVGEHFVVYGKPAIVMAVNRYVKVTVQGRDDDAMFISSDLGISGSYIDGQYKGLLRNRNMLEPIKISVDAVLNRLDEKQGLNIQVDSTIPVAVGLGSSGALAVATVAAVGKFLGRDFSKEEIIDLSLHAEKFVHVNPSGIDQSVSTYGGVISYNKRKGITRLKVVSPIPIVIGNTGIQRNTGKLVDGVRVKRRRFPKIMATLFHAAELISLQAIDALANDDFTKLGELMDINHGLLVTIGVSHRVLDKLVNTAKERGALGAKLTGAGGGGCMIALTTFEKRDDISKAISKVEGTPIIAEKVDRGVHSWINE